MNASRVQKAFVLGTALAAGACAGAGGSGPAPTPTPASSTVDELEALYRARQDSALLRVSQADVDFMTGMIDHHAQALVMSAFAPANGANPTVRTRFAGWPRRADAGRIL